MGTKRNAKRTKRDKITDHNNVTNGNVTNDKLQALEPFRESGADEMLTTNQGVRDQRQPELAEGGRARADAARRLPSSARRSRTSTTSASPSASCTRAASAAHGYLPGLRVAGDATRRRASCRTRSAQTPVFVRFSTVAGSRGSTDLARDVRGFAVKFYTEEGNFDLVGNNMPVFFIQDAIKFPDLVHAVKPEPHNEMPQAASAHDTFWDFISLMPEIDAHDHVGDVGPRDPAQLPDDGGLRRPHLPLRQRSGRVALREVPLEAAARRALGRRGTRRRRSPARTPTSTAAICGRRSSSGDFPEWELGVQIVEEEDEHKFDFDLLDPTKIIPEELVPVQRDRQADARTATPTTSSPRPSRSRSTPGTSCPGIDFTNDPLLQGRLFSYTDTQLIRLGGPNFHEIPINRPIAPVHNNQRDGYMRQTINTRPGVSYEPNSLGGGCPFQAGARDGRLRQLPRAHRRHEGPRARARSFFDHFSQATLFFNSQSEPEQEHIVEALRFELGKVETAADPRAHGRHAGAGRRDAGRAASPTGSASRRPEGRARR